MGLKVLSAASGNEALHICDNLTEMEEFIDIIFVDYSMPGMHGDELTSMLREGNEQSSTKKSIIIGLTSHTDAETRRLCLQSGMNKVEHKPLSAKKLTQILKDYNLIDVKPTALN